ARFLCMIISFFFQAEDGIRYDLVTGVQTCALPISSSEKGSCTPGNCLVVSETGQRRPRRGDAETHFARHNGPYRRPIGLQDFKEIGRASCRERGKREV